MSGYVLHFFNVYDPETAHTSAGSNGVLRMHFTEVESYRQRPISAEDFDSLDMATMRNWVSGNFEQGKCIWSGYLRSFLCNERGHELGLPLNKKATEFHVAYLRWSMCGEEARLVIRRQPEFLTYYRKSAPIVGNVVVIENPDEDDKVVVPRLGDSLYDSPFVPTHSPPVIDGAPRGRKR